MLRYTISREDYDRIAEPEYPKSTQEAVVEMRTRGADADLNSVNHMIKKEMVGNPPRSGYRYEWGPEDVDRFIDFFEEEGWFTPHTHTAHYLNLNPTELREAMTKAGDMANLAVLTFTLGAPGADVYGQISIRPMNPKEIAAHHAEIAKIVSKRGIR